VVDTNETELTIPSRTDSHDDFLNGGSHDQPEYEPFWAAAAALGLPLSLHTAT